MGHATTQVGRTGGPQNQKDLKTIAVMDETRSTSDNIRNYGSSKTLARIVAESLAVVLKL